MKKASFFFDAFIVFNVIRYYLNSRQWHKGKTMKAIIYTRVSTGRQAKEGDSLEAQESRLQQYAAFKGFNTVELVTDAGVSGKETNNRPGFVRIMDAVKSGEVDAVIVYSLSRFARNTIATLESVELMNRKGVTFHSLTESIDTTTAAGRFFLTTLAALAQLEREQIGERTSSVLQHKKAQGERVGQIPFGKRLSVDGVQLEDCPAEQKAISIIHKLRKAGYTYDRIASELVERGVKNKVGTASWNTTQIFRIIKRAA